MLRKGLNICCQHLQDQITGLRSSVLALTLSYSHCLQKSTETGQIQRYCSAQLPIFSSTLGGGFALPENFVSTRHSLLDYLLLFWSSCSWGKHLEGRACKIPVLLCAHERAEMGSLKQGKNKERKRNGCRKSVLGKIKILGSRIPMIALYRSVTMAS